MNRFKTLGLCWLFCVSRAAAADTNGVRPWLEYRTIMWIGDTAYNKPDKLPLFFQRLREMGVNTGMVHHDGDPRPLLDAKFPYYVENIVNKGLCLKWNSNVRDWGRFVTIWAKSGRAASAMIRDYCLDDPKWRGWARDEMRRLVQKNAPNNPLAYNIRDELSTTISANPFDYDFNPITLEKFREWLRTQYRGLDALNAEWETRIVSWNEVKPFTTDEIKNRMSSGEAFPRGNPDWQALERLKFDPVEARNNPTRWNFSPWCDFRTFMDISLAGALDDIRNAARQADPRTPVGTEGAQAPSAFGGYDLWRLSRVLDWIEPYDIGGSREILGSFMPGKPMLTTVFEKDTNHALRRLWHLLLEGDRGCIVWWSEDCIDWKSDDYALTPKAGALAPALREMTSPLARLFLRAERIYDPIAIYYSQPGIQVDWLLESTVDGATWPRRFSSYEADHNRLMRVRDSWLKAFQDLGYSPRFVSPEQIEAGGLANFRVLVLPQCYALSDREMLLIRDFARPAGNSLLGDGSPGLFDERGRLRVNGQPLAPPALSEKVAFAPRDKKEGDISSYGAARLAAEPATGWPKWIAGNVGFPPSITVPLESRTRIHQYRLGGARLVAFERNVGYQMSEDLKQAGGNGNLEKPIDLEAKLDKPAHAYDLRTRKYLGLTDRIAFVLDPWQPSLFALLPDRIAEGKLVEFLDAQQGH